MSTTYSQGERISLRGEDFLIRNTKTNPDGSHILSVEGLSELVHGQRFSFDTSLENDIKRIDPKQTFLLADNQAGGRKAKLFIEAHLRYVQSMNNGIGIAHKAAFNLSDYQFVPTQKALSLPRQRMLIADGVGLGKTIEVGIFLAEMIKRGRGKRILVLALKSILSQFQQEIWSRFAIPLVRLDSHGIAKIKAELPINKNPFAYYDKTIISIDTLKNNEKFRHYIEKSKWDIIVIDECHTVSNASSLRGDLAQFLATRCESLVLTSATPHNGKKENFSNLLRMIDPIAIPRDENYNKEDILPYYVRRFKNDIADETVRSNFKDREIVPIHAPLTPSEESLLEIQQKMKFESLKQLDETAIQKQTWKNNQAEKQDLLFSIGLFKAYMSSPKAALESVGKRISKLREKKLNSERLSDNIEMLEDIHQQIENIVAKREDSKYSAFRTKLNKLKWKGKKQDERIVVFAERIDTIHYLKENIQRDFKVKDNAIGLFHGSLTDVEQEQMIEDFGKQDSDLRLLIASDAGSQGVNLHHYCHLMFNYDIPWSLITLEQRNGRIDRYGQKQTPYIFYIIGKSEQVGLKTDLHILENLTKKEDEVHKTLGDAATVMQLYDADKESQMTEIAIVTQNEDFLYDEEDEEDWAEEIDLNEILGRDTDNTATEAVDINYQSVPSLFGSDKAFYKSLFDQLKSNRQITDSDADFVSDNYLELANTPELERVIYDLPKEALPQDNIFRLTTDIAKVQDSIAEARKKKGEWPKFQLLYDLHPVLHYYISKLEASVDKEVALVNKIDALPPNTAWFVLHGQVANNLGQAVISDFFVVPMYLHGGLYEKAKALSEFVSEFGIDKELYPQLVSDAEIEKLSNILPDAIDRGMELHMHQEQQKQAIRMESEQKLYAEKLKNWERNAQQHILSVFEGQTNIGFVKSRRERMEYENKNILNTNSQYHKDLYSLNNDAHIKVLAVYFNK